MPAYLLANVQVTDPALYDQYRQQVAPLVAEYGGRFVVRGGAAERLEGELPVNRQIVIEFPSMAVLKAWYHSPQYAPMIELRQRASIGTLVAVEGV